jgi:hypothetical protein
MTQNIFLGLDPSKVVRVETMGSRDRIPNGVYLAEATSAVKQIARSNGECTYWHLFFTILEGEFKGYGIPARFNCDHQNSEVIELGQGQLCHYLDCIGNTDPQCEADFCHVPVLITVLNKKNKFDRNGKEVEAMVSEVRRFDALTEPAA